MSNTRSPLANARGLGSAKAGTEHWWMQRLTAVANIFLSIALLLVLASLAGSTYVEVQASLARPIPTIVLTLFIAVTYFHAALGLQVVIEDYVHNRLVHMAMMIFVRFGLIVLGLASILMVLRNFFGA